MVVTWQTLQNTLVCGAWLQSSSVSCNCPLLPDRKRTGCVCHEMPCESSTSRAACSPFRSIKTTGATPSPTTASKGWVAFVQVDMAFSGPVKPVLSPESASTGAHMEASARKFRVRAGKAASEVTLNRRCGILPTTGAKMWWIVAGVVLLMVVVFVYWMRTAPPEPDHHKDEQDL